MFSEKVDTRQNSLTEIFTQKSTDKVGTEIAGQIMTRERQNTITKSACKKARKKLTRDNQTKCQEPNSREARTNNEN